MIISAPISTHSCKGIPLFISLILLTAASIQAQNINYEMHDVAFFRLPLKPLDPAAKTYSVSLEDLGNALEPRHKDSLLNKALVLPGYQRVREAGDVQLELIISPLTVTNKEAKDKPLELEKDGKKTVMHQYSYAITYSFPTKLRVTCLGKLIGDQDMPGFFNTDYFPKDGQSLSSLQSEYDHDYYFIGRLRQERVDQRVYDIKQLVFSNYGKAMAYQVINIGYVKDKKGLYEDVNKAYALLHEAFIYAHRKEPYLDETFKGKTTAAIEMLEEIAAESSDDKKARIDPKVTAMLHYDLALAHYGLNKFDEAQAYLDKIQKAPSNTGYMIRQLADMIQDRRARFAANGLLGRPPVAADEIKPVAPTITKKPVGLENMVHDYVEGNNGDTVNVRIIQPSQDVMAFGDSVWLQDQIIILKKDKRIEVYPGEIRGYSYKGVYRESLSWIKDMNTSPWTFEKKFCKRIVNGAIPVFKCYEVVPSRYNANEKVVTTKLMYKQKNELYQVMFLNFNKGVSKVVTDYPELAEKVRNGAYQREDFVKVITEYNTWMANNNK